jgi:hypothetical protein
MTDLVYTHLNARAPGPNHPLFINRYGVLFEHMQASTLIRIDAQELRLLTPWTYLRDGSARTSSVQTLQFFVPSDCPP